MRLFQKSTYLGNPKLKAAGVKIDFTQEQVAEIIKCSKDPIYFIENYVKIISLDKGLIPCVLYDHQKRMIKNFIDNRFSISLCSRQIGKCCDALTRIRLKNKETNQIVEMTMKEFFEINKNSALSSEKEDK